MSCCIKNKISSIKTGQAFGSVTKRKVDHSLLELSIIKIISKQGIVRMRLDLNSLSSFIQDKKNNRKLLFQST